MSEPREMNPPPRPAGFEAEFKKFWNGAPEDFPLRKVDAKNAFAHAWTAAMERAAGIAEQTCTDKLHKKPLECAKRIAEAIRSGGGT